MCPSEDDDSIGVMFRYQDENNYYRFCWGSQRPFRRLAKCENGNFTLLAEDYVGYTVGQTYDVEIIADGINIEVWVDGVRVLYKSDTRFSEGTIALYCWGNAGSYFDDIIVEDLCSGTISIFEDFDDGDFEGWVIIDQGDQDAPSDWSAATGAMVQSSNIYSLPTGDELPKLGTFAFYEGDICGLDDFVSMSAEWLYQDCDPNNNWCHGSDYDFSSTVDFSDFTILVKRWLENLGW